MNLLDPNATEGGADTKQVDVPAIVESLLKKYGTADNALAKLISENYELRDERRKLREQLPGPDSIVLTGDQVRDWEAYRELGKPSDVRKQREQASRDAEELAKLRRADLMRRVAETYGYNPSVLGTILENVEVRLNDRAKGRDGRAAPTWEVVSQGDEESDPTPLPEWLEVHRRDFLPALVPQGAASPLVASTPPPRAGTPSPPPAKGRRLLDFADPLAIEEALARSGSGSF